MGERRVLECCGVLLENSRFGPSSSISLIPTITVSIVTVTDVLIGDEISRRTLPELRRNPVESRVSKQRRRSSLRSGKRSQPLVGIIFLLPPDRLLIESSEVSEAELCAGFANHPRGHNRFWAHLQDGGLAPRDQDYIDVPRGRVILSTQTGEYSLLLDRCILREPKLVREIRERMNLPSRGLVITTDDHYRCAFCMSKSSL